MPFIQSKVYMIAPTLLQMAAITMADLQMATTVMMLKLVSLTNTTKSMKLKAYILDLMTIMD